MLSGYQASLDRLAQRDVVEQYLLLLLDPLAHAADLFE